MSDSLQPHGLYSPWNSPGQNSGVGSLSLLQGIFPTQGSSPGLPHYRQILYQMRHKGSPINYTSIKKKQQQHLFTVFQIYFEYLVFVMIFYRKNSHEFNIIGSRFCSSLSFLFKCIIIIHYYTYNSFFFGGNFTFIYLFFKFYFIFKFYIIVLVLPSIKMNLPQVYMCSPS